MGTCQIFLLVSFLWTCGGIASNSNNRTILLPRSVIELKKYYEVVENFEQRGILTGEQARQEKQLYIEFASKLIEKDRLLTTKEFLEYEKYVSIISFSNIVATLAGLIIFIAGLMYISCYIKPNLTEIPMQTWEMLLYCFTFSLIFFSNHSWLVFLGCLTLFASLKVSVYLGRFGQETDCKIMIWFILFISWSMVTVYQRSREVRYLAIVALEVLSCLIIQEGELPALLGCRKHKLVPSVTISSFSLSMIGGFLHFIPLHSFISLFTRPLLLIGAVGYFSGLFILSSKFYERNQDPLSLIEVTTFLSGLAAISFAPMFGLPYLQIIGGTTFIVWLLKKYVQYTSWTTIRSTIISLFGLSILLYVFAYLYKTIFSIFH